MKFHIGDSVLITRNFDGAYCKGVTGTVIRIGTYGRYGLKLDKPQKFGHTMLGMVPRGYGWSAREESLTLLDSFEGNI